MKDIYISIINIEKVISNTIDWEKNEVGMYSEEILSDLIPKLSLALDKI